MREMTPDLPPSEGPAPERRGRPRSAFVTLCRLMLRTQVTRARVLSLGALSAFGVLVGWLLGNAPRVHNHLRAGTDFVNLFGLSLLVPVAALVFASSMFGDLTDDGTLVYLWLRPVARTKIVLAAALTSFLVTWPLVVPPLVVAASLTGAGSDLVIGTLVAGTVVTLAYVGVFVALGLRVKRPLVWGLLYIFIWEGFIARGSENAAKAAIRAYGSSILHETTNVRVELATIDWTWAIVVPLVFGVLGLAYAVFRLRRQDVA